MTTILQSRLLRSTIALAVAAAAGGCATPSTNMRIGGEQSYLSLQAQREAVLSVSEWSAPPAGAQALGPVDASRCHRFQGDIEPSREQLIGDLKAAAYARGADGIVITSVEKQSGLTRNCWYIITARADMYRGPAAGGQAKK